MNFGKVIGVINIELDKFQFLLFGVFLIGFVIAVLNPLNTLLQNDVIRLHTPSFCNMSSFCYDSSFYCLYIHKQLLKFVFHETDSNF